MDNSFAYIKSFNDCKFRFRFRERGGALKVRLAIGRRSRGRVATRTVTLMDGISPGARWCDIRAIVNACARLYAHPVIGWRVAWRFEPAVGEVSAAEPLRAEADHPALRLFAGRGERAARVIRAALAVAAAIAVAALAAGAKFGRHFVARR